jgi:hypothetical protein
MAGPSGPRAEPHGIGPAVAGPGGLRAEPHGIAPTTPHEIRPASPRNYARAGAPTVAAQMGRGGEPLSHEYGRPEVFHTPAPTYHAAVQQFGRPQVALPPQMMGRGMSPAMGRGMPQIAARPAVTGGGAALHKK